MTSQFDKLGSIGQTSGSFGEGRGRRYNMPPTDTVVVIVRHPDHELAIETFGDEPRIVELDLGSGFDITHPQVPEDQQDVIEWVDSILEDVNDLPTDHPARMYVKAQLDIVMDAFSLVWSDGEEDDDESGD